MNWATVKLSGTLYDIKEDLTAQLSSAAASRMIEMIPELGQGVIDLATKGALPEGSVQNVAENVKKTIQGVAKPTHVVGETLGTGASIIGSILGTGGTKTQKLQSYSVDGIQFELTSDWQPVAKTEATSPIAKLETNGNHLASLYLLGKQGKARDFSDAWRKLYAEKSPPVNEFLTKNGLPAILSVSLNDEQQFAGQQGRATVVVFVQMDETKAGLLRIETRPVELDAIKQYAKDVAQSLTLERKAENKGLLEKIVPETQIIDDLLPF